MGPIAATRPPLLPRYRRPFSVSAVLDDTIQVFRQVWLPMVGLNLLVGVLSLLVTGIAIGAFLVAGGLVIVTFFVDVIRAAAATGAATGAGRTAAPAVLPTALPSVPESALAAAVIAGGAALLASALLGTTWYAATSLMTEDVLRGERRGIWPALTAGVRRAPALIGAGVLYAVGLLLAAAMAFVIVYVLRGWTFLAAVVAIAGLIFWAANRDARREWVKWLVVVTTPFGLPFYVSILWSLFVPAGAVEGAGPIRALRRSAELVSGHWFRVWGMWLLVGIIVSLLQAIPGALVGALFAGLGGAPVNTLQGLNLIFTVGRVAGSYIGGVLFAAVPMSAATVAFVALRNQREGADLAERLAALEVPPAAPAHLEALDAPPTPTTLS